MLCERDWREEGRTEGLAGCARAGYIEAGVSERATGNYMFASSAIQLALRPPSANERGRRGPGAVWEERSAEAGDGARVRKGAASPSRESEPVVEHDVDWGIV